MKYSIGENLAECSFRVLEKIHEPILLVNRLGRIIKINEAARKLANVAHLSLNQIEKLIAEQVIGNIRLNTPKRMWLHCRKKNLQVVTTVYDNSDYFLIEIKR